MFFFFKIRYLKSYYKQFHLCWVLIIKTCWTYAPLRADISCFFFLIIFLCLLHLSLFSSFSPPDHENGDENNLARSVSVATGLNSMARRPRVRTIFPHTAGNNSTLLSFDEGDIIILLIPDERDGWMYGEMEKNGKWVLTACCCLFGWWELPNSFGVI